MAVRMTAKEARAAGIKPPARTKYRSRKTVVDGITFDSKKEADYYIELKLRQRAGEIASFELQPAFILQEGFRTKNGKKEREIRYKADFRVVYPDGREEIVDTKGYRTKEYLLKRKMLLFRYPEINFVEA